MRTTFNAISMASSQILIVDLNDYYGGGQVYLNNLIQLLKEDVSFLALTVNPNLARILRSRGIKVFSCERVLKFGKIVHLCFAFIMIAYFKARYRIDTVWIQGSTEVVLLPWAQMLSCKTLATRHGTFGTAQRKGFGALRSNIKKQLHRIFSFSIYKMICVSKTVAFDAAQAVPQKRLVAIPNWVACLPEPLIPHYLQGKVLQILFVGRLEKHKRIDLILNAMRKIESTALSGKVSLTLVGAGEFRLELERLAKGLNVRFVGFQKDTSIFYQKADVFINASMGPEGLPLASIEAMSYGLPCILSNIAVHKEIASNGENAVLFVDGDYEDLFLKIELLINSLDLLERYSRLGRKAVVENYSANVARTSYLKELGL